MVRDSVLHSNGMVELGLLRHNDVNGGPDGAQSLIWWATHAVDEMGVLPSSSSIMDSICPCKKLN